MGLIISGSFDQKKKKKSTVTVLHSDRNKIYFCPVVVGVFPFTYPAIWVKFGFKYFIWRSPK